MMDCWRPSAKVTLLVVVVGVVSGLGQKDHEETGANQNVFVSSGCGEGETGRTEEINHFCGGCWAEGGRGEKM